MSIERAAQSSTPCTLAELSIGVDVGGTFTDLVASDGTSLQVLKLSSTPPHFHRAVIEAAVRAAAGRAARVVHGSTVATNALLQRSGEPIAFVTTDGFADMLLIGRQNRPKLYALEIERAEPIAPPENCFTVRERIDAHGEVVQPLTDDEIAALVAKVIARGLRHAAVCLLFSFITPEHERRIGRALEGAGIRASLSCDVLPEFREYERASTTAINASLRPVVQQYLEALEAGLPPEVSDLRIMQSGGGTLGVSEASRSAAKLVLSGPAGGVLGAAYVATAAGFQNVITYDMGGTSTDVATILDGQPQWTTSTTVDGLPIGLPMFDIHTIGAGGGSIAYLDAGGALRVGPRSAGAVPGPACYGRGGTEPTVTDANVVLGRIVPGAFLDGQMRIDVARAHAVVERLGQAMNKSAVEAAIGIIRVAESNMQHAVRAVTSRRGHDPRQFTLVSFGGAGGLHACALAEALEITRILVPPYCGVLSALGMVVAPPVVDASRTVVHLGEQLDSDRIAAEYGGLSGETLLGIPYEQTASVEVYADVRFRGQSHELKVRVQNPSIDHIRERYIAAYEVAYGRVPEGREIEVVTLRIRRIGKRRLIDLPKLEPELNESRRSIDAFDVTGTAVHLKILSRRQLLGQGATEGPLLLIDPEATTFVNTGWKAVAIANGSVILNRAGPGSSESDEPISEFKAR